MLYTSKGKRHLIILPDDPSEFLLSQGLINDLRQLYPNSKLDVMAPVGFLHLAQRFAPIKKVWAVPSPKHSWKTFWKAGIDLQNQGYSHAWVLPERFKPALIPALANIPKRCGYIGRYRYALLIDIRLPRRDAAQNLHLHYRALAWEAGAAVPQGELFCLAASPAAQQELAHKLELNLERPILAWSPEVADFRPEVFSALQNALENNWQVCLVAQQDQQATLNMQLSKAPQLLQTSIRNFAGHLSWVEALDLLALSRLHLAADNQLALLGLSAKTEVMLTQVQHTPTSAVNLGAQEFSVAKFNTRLSL